jgi:hypothetical protein
LLFPRCLGPGLPLPARVENEGWPAFPDPASTIRHNAVRLEHIVVRHYAANAQSIDIGTIIELVKIGPAKQRVTGDAIDLVSLLYTGEIEQFIEDVSSSRAECREYVTDGHYV